MIITFAVSKVGTLPYREIEAMNLQ